MDRLLAYMVANEKIAAEKKCSLGRECPCMGINHDHFIFCWEMTDEEFEAHLREYTENWKTCSECGGVYPDDVETVRARAALFGRKGRTDEHGKNENEGISLPGKTLQEQVQSLRELASKNESNDESALVMHKSDFGLS